MRNGKGIFDKNELSPVMICMIRKSELLGDLWVTCGLAGDLQMICR